MNREERTLLTGFTVTLALLPLVLGMSLDWPVWLWLPLVLVMLLVPVGVRRAIVDRRRQQSIREEMREQREESRTEQPMPTHPSFVVEGLKVPSAHPEYKMLLTATVNWIPGPGAAGPSPDRMRSIAVDAIHRRAGAITAESGALDYEITVHRLSVALGTMQHDPEGHLQAWAHDVSLTLPQADAERLRRLGDIAKDEEIFERGRDYERNLRRYLTEDALADHGTAVVWWLAQNEISKERLDQTMELVQRLRELTGLAAGSEQYENQQAPASWWESSNQADTSPSSSWLVGADGGGVSPNLLPTNEPDERSATLMYFAKHIIESGYPEGGDERRLFAQRVADVLALHRMQREADGIRQQYELDDDAPDSSIPDKDGDEADSGSVEDEPR